MTQTQRLIKYLATSFAIFLIVVIISVILGCGYFLLSAVGLVHTNKNVITKDLNVISGEVGEISELEIDLAFTNLEIISGNNFKVETNNLRIAFLNNNGKIKVKEKRENWFDNISYSDNSNLVL